MLSSHLFAREEGQPGVPDVAEDPAVVRGEIGAICESTHLVDDLRAARSGILVKTVSDEKMKKTSIFSSASAVKSSSLASLDSRNFKLQMPSINGSRRKRFGQTLEMTSPSLNQRSTMSSW